MFVAASLVRAWWVRSWCGPHAVRCTGRRRRASERNRPASLPCEGSRRAFASGALPTEDAISPWSVMVCGHSRRPRWLLERRPGQHGGSTLAVLLSARGSRDGRGLCLVLRLSLRLEQPLKVLVEHRRARAQAVALTAAP